MRGRPEPDRSLRDTENVPLTEHIEEYFAREVLPHVADAWIDERVWAWDQTSPIPSVEAANMLRAITSAPYGRFVHPGIALTSSNPVSDQYS